MSPSKARTPRSVTAALDARAGSSGASAHACAARRRRRPRRAESGENAVGDEADDEEGHVENEVATAESEGATPEAPHLRARQNEEGNGDVLRCHRENRQDVEELVVAEH